MLWYSEGSRETNLNLSVPMAQNVPANCLRMHRKKSGLTLREIAQVLGHDEEALVSRHERGLTIPPLHIALAYEALFQVPVSKLFPAAHQEAMKNVEARLAHLESTLGEKSAKARGAQATARKLQFTWEHKNGIEIDP